MTTYVSKEPIEYHSIRWYVYLRWMTGVMVGITVSVLISIYIGRDNQVAACIRNSSSKAIDAAFYDSASEARSKEGDIETSLAYLEFARQKRMTIPMPADWNGSIDMRGTDSSERRRGCQEAYPPPIPFIK